MLSGAGAQHTGVEHLAVSQVLSKWYGGVLEEDRAALDRVLRDIPGQMGSGQFARDEHNLRTVTGGLLHVVKEEKRGLALVLVFPPETVVLIGLPELAAETEHAGVSWGGGLVGTGEVEAAAGPGLVLFDSHARGGESNATMRLWRDADTAAARLYDMFGCTEELDGFQAEGLRLVEVTAVRLLSNGEGSRREAGAERRRSSGARPDGTRSGQGSCHMHIEREGGMEPTLPPSHPPSLPPSLPPFLPPSLPRSRYSRRVARVAWSWAIPPR